MSRRLTAAHARDLIDAGAVRAVSIEPAPGDGWAVVMRVGMEARPIASARQDVRTWRSLDTVSRFLDGLGVAGAEIRFR